MSALFKTKNAPAKIEPGHFYTPNQLQAKAEFAERQGKFTTAMFYFAWMNYLLTRHFRRILVEGNSPLRHKYLGYCRRDKNWLRSRADKLRAELPARSLTL